jgi:hypothetical protein
MYWTDRQRLVILGAPLAIIPALAFLPAFAYLIITPSTRHPRLLASIVFPAFALCEVVGIVRLARCCVARPFDLLTAFSFAALLVILVIATYTGLFLAAIAGAM